MHLKYNSHFFLSVPPALRSHLSSRGAVGKQMGARSMICGALVVDKFLSSFSVCNLVEKGRSLSLIWSGE